MSKRRNIEYASQRVMDGMTVLEALMEAPSRGYTVRDLVKKTGLNYDPVRRALFAHEVKGYARRFLGAWKPGDKCRVFAARAEMAFAQQDNDVLALANSMREF